MTPTFSKRFLWLGPVVALAVSAVPAVAVAEPSPSDMAQARELLNQGLDLRDKGDANGALQKLQGAHALANTPITGMELGRTYVTVGKLVEAREVFLSVARIPVRSDETSRSKAARAESEKLARELRDRIPSVTVKVTGVPLETLSVAIDGAAVPAEALAAPRLLDPGSHQVVARSSAGGTAETQITLQERETRDVELKIAPSAAAASAPAAHPVAPGQAPALPANPPDAPPSSRSHALDGSLVGVGAAVGIAGGVVMGVAAEQARRDVNGLDRPAYDAAKNLWIGGLVGTIVGGVAAASGVILFAATAGSKPATGSHSVWVRVGANDLQVGGTW